MNSVEQITGVMGAGPLCGSPVQSGKMQRSILQRVHHAGLFGVERGVQHLLERRGNAELLILVSLAVVGKGVRGFVKAHPCGGDPGHPKDDAEAYSRKDDDREGGARSLLVHLQGIVNSMADGEHLIDRKDMIGTSRPVGNLLQSA